MTISMFSASVPRLANALTNLAHLLSLAQTHVETHKINPDAILNFRLFPDMLDFKRQVQIACDTCKGVVARLGGVESPVFEDKEQSFAELQERIAKTIAYIEGFSAAQIDGTEDKDIVVTRGEKQTHYKGMQFLLGHALPNVYFHSSVAYSILRHNGVAVGKRDYLGKP